MAPTFEININLRQNFLVYSVYHDFHLISLGILVKLIRLNLLNPLMPGGNKKVTHTLTNLQLKAFLLPPGIKGSILKNKKLTAIPN